MEELKKFKEIFWLGFHTPKLSTHKFIDLWNQLEAVNEMLAGPFFAIYSNDHCDYIFSDKTRFPNIKDADDFLDYCTFHIHHYSDAVSELACMDEAEENDQKILLHQTDIKMELANLAYGIIGSRQ